MNLYWAPPWMVVVCISIPIELHHIQGELPTFAGRFGPRGAEISRTCDRPGHPGNPSEAARQGGSLVCTRPSCTPCRPDGRDQRGRQLLQVPFGFGFAGEIELHLQ